MIQKKKWQTRISEVDENSTVMFTDGSMQEDDKKVWVRKRKEGDKEVIIDLVEDFFTKLNL